jgi:hypothetical protein
VSKTHADEPKKVNQLALSEASKFIRLNEAREEVYDLSRHHNGYSVMHIEVPILGIPACGTLVSAGSRA